MALEVVGDTEALERCRKHHKGGGETTRLVAQMRKALPGSAAHAPVPFFAFFLPFFPKTVIATSYVPPLACLPFAHRP